MQAEMTVCQPHTLMSSCSFETLFLMPNKTKQDETKHLTFAYNTRVHAYTFQSLISSALINQIIVNLCHFNVFCSQTHGVHKDTKK